MIMPEINGNQTTAQQEGRLAGHIANLSPSAKHFGFIRLVGQKEEYFFHETDLSNCTWTTIQVGQAVSFRGEPSTKGNGLRARDVDVTDGRYRP
jgi:cold shock CspA family protein